MPPPDAARRHYSTEEAINARTFRAVAGLWRQVDPFDLDRSWLRLLPRAVATVTVGQSLAVQAADGYVTDVLDEQGIDPARMAEVNGRAFVGVSASDDRLLAEVLREPVVASKVATLNGVPAAEAVDVQGMARLARVVTSQLADTGRGVTSVAMAATPASTGYVRMVRAPACSRCAILAGKFFEWNKGFLRHPMCQCTHIPSAEDAAGDARTDPKAYFDSLDAAEQDRIFTAAGAQSIRDGADMNQVVNSRRGMYWAGDGTQATREGTTRRGFAGQRIGGTTTSVVRPGRTRSRPTVTAVRPLPETIYEQAKNRAEAVELLRRYGYLL